MKQLNSHDFEEIYWLLKVDIDKLGCIMLDIKPGSIPELLDEKDLYITKDENKYWIKGFVGQEPHMTLLYGLMQPGLKWKLYVDKVLKGWKLDSIQIKEVGHFESNQKEENYYCLVAHIEITPKLLEGHERLQFLPHIDTFTGYKAHVTIAYVKKDPVVLEKAIKLYNDALKGKQLKITGVNYGK